MAEPTIQLGGGNWAGKTDNLLGYYKEGERFYKQDFTFSRSTTGTYTDSDGYIQDMPYNLLQQSNQFDTTWYNTNTTETSGHIGYDGTNNAWLLTKTASYYARIQQSITSTSGVKTFSVYLKEGTLSWCRVLAISASSPECYVNLSNGSLGSQYNNITATSTDVGAGWYRVSLTFNDTISQVRIYPADANNSVSGISGSIYIQDAQLVKGTSAKTYFPTTTRLNVPRVDYLNNSNGSLILEPQRTNLITYSESFDNAYWTKSQVTITANDTTSPDGTTNADKIVETVNNSEHIFYKTGISTLGTISIYAKADNSGRLFQIRRDAGTGTNSWAWFNLDNGTVESEDAGVASIESLSNNWYRCIFTPTNASGTIVFSISNGATTRSVSYQGDGTSGVYLWGAQLEAGSYPTSLIPTTGTTVTRLADASATTGLSDVIGQTEGVLFVEIAALADDSNERFLSVSDGTTVNRVSLWYYSATNGLAIAVYSGNVAQFFTTTILSNDTDYNKIAIKYKVNDFALWVNGVEIATDTSGLAPVGLSKLSFDKGNNTLRFEGKCQNLQIFKTALTDTELATLTT